MKTGKILAIVVLALALIVCVAKVSEAAPMGTAFTYQGHLYDANYPADDIYDFQFKLYDDPCDANQIGSDVNKPDVEVIDGYFTVELDFGSVFEGDDVWLHVGVRPGEMNDPNIYTPLLPRQEVTPVPYSLQTRGIYVDNSGNVGIGTTSPGAKLDVAGNTRITGDLNVNAGNVTVTGPEKIKQPTQTVTYRFSPGGWSIRTDVGDVFQEPVAFTTSLMMKGGGAGNNNIAVMPLCLPRTGTIKEMRVRCRMTGPSGTGTAFQVVLLHQNFSSSVGSPSGDPSFLVYYNGSSTANMTLTETQDHTIQSDHTYLLFALAFGNNVDYVEIGMVELDIETTEYSPTRRW